ncbi:Uba4p Ecym_5521 [Eremothecium cymbalariae DBVPG|uniref:Needs CLA4 to survive protein 3 n=1 Tax=Eremothecium cymbalariae (strain CBS 270.75 / DBVPG 7215 / KCTC 17166 / NRRL Y-17582) TaxID=931890 RepID=I6NDX0_ERECY|nr:hypothetical protein Ecym_5521 [Eremothecium cymbalariae DBVPG\
MPAEKELLLQELEALKLENFKLKKQLEQQREQKETLPMSLEEYSRYGRQMIVEQINGVEGQVKLREAKVLVIGAGGLGCPSLPYLVGAGVGHIGIVDDDIVDASNLHRQILHDSVKVGMLKCESAKQVLNKLNPHVQVATYPVRLDNKNAFQIMANYDIIMDCTDTPLARYLISDVAVNLGKTVVSASGLGTEGQLSIYNFKNVGPCYRCFYPNPPPPGSVTSCQQGGVVGPCIGLVGVMMAVETMKVILETYTVENFSPFLIQYSGFPQQSLRTFKMRGKKKDCISCGYNPTVTREAIESGDVNYSNFCGGSRDFNVLADEERITVQQFQENYWLDDKKDYILLDVRPRLHYNVSHLPKTYNVTMKELKDMDGDLKELQKRIPRLTTERDIIVLCRHGNESRLATRVLKDEFRLNNVKDIKGGYFQYIDEISPFLPKY